MFDDPLLSGAILTALLLSSFGWWVGFRWRSFAIVAGGTVLGGGLGYACGVLATPANPGWLDGLRILEDEILGVLIGGGVAFVAVVLYHVVRRRRQQRRIAAWVGGVASAAVDDGSATLNAGHLEGSLASMEQGLHVKYLPWPQTGVAAYEDWAEIAEDPAANANTYLIVPHRARVRSRKVAGSDGLPRVQPALSNPFDCVVLIGMQAGAFRVMPASKSRFCQSAMEFLRPGSG